ncbi:MAG TPA: hypothetical protein VEI97_01090 [bacterium]|nr:hypothetical protein [bacterium]
MAAPLRLTLPELVARIKAHFEPLEARVNFPGNYDRIANIKVVDDTDQVIGEYSAKGETPESLLAEVLFGMVGEVLMIISDPQPDPAEEDLFRWELVARYGIPEDLDPEEWLSVPEGRHAWGEWTTWHDHTRVATIWPPR